MCQALCWTIFEVLFFCEKSSLFLCRCTQRHQIFFSIPVKTVFYSVVSLGERQGRLRGRAGAVPASLVSTFYFDRSDGDSLALGPRRQSASVCPVGSFNLPYTQTHCETDTHSHTLTHTTAGSEAREVRPASHPGAFSSPAGRVSLGARSSAGPRSPVRGRARRTPVAPWANAGGRARRRAARARGWPPPRPRLCPPPRPRPSPRPCPRSLRGPSPGAPSRTFSTPARTRWRSTLTLFCRTCRFCSRPPATWSRSRKKTKVSLGAPALPRRPALSFSPLGRPLSRARPVPPPTPPPHTSSPWQ